MFDNFFSTLVVFNGQLKITLNYFYVTFSRKLQRNFLNQRLIFSFMKGVSRFVYFRVKCNCLDDFASSNGGRGDTWMGVRGMIREGESSPKLF